MKKICIAFIVAIIGVSGCEDLFKPYEGVIGPLSLIVSPAIDTLHVGDTLWLIAGFSSQLRTNTGKKFDIFDNASIDVKIRVESFTDGLTSYYSFTYAEQISCNDGTCRLKHPIPLTQIGSFFLVAEKLDDYDPISGALRLRSGTKIARVGVQYEFIPDKQARFDELSNSDDKELVQIGDVAYPFVVI
ncbi:hypothetical protein FACS1894199_05200 [Bacteroidia bacterium]|nr:hypothetical protein FACS1894199_05200 [Bacteroidia bacterium]